MEKVFSIFDTYGHKIVEIPYDEKVLLSIGDMVVFKDSENREEFGIVRSVGNSSFSEDGVIRGGKILRLATANDVQKYENYKELSKNAISSCQKLSKKYSLDMQVFGASYSFDGSRLLLLFTAEERIDFRDLVKDLAKSFQKQIYLRQVGPRDKAKVIGGFGKCGRALCCNSFLNKLESINMEMVRLQALEGKGSSKLSGVCGKLLCCLKYEVEAYKDLRSKLPNIGDIVKISKKVVAPRDEARVVAIDVLNSKAKVFFHDAEEYMVLTAEEIESVIAPVEQKSETKGDGASYSDNIINY